MFAQIGRTVYRPPHIRWTAFLTPSQSAECLDEADVIVSHAGTGTIIGALERRKPIIVVPRQTALGEHRNDHQVATARRFGARGLVVVAEDEQSLCAKLDEISCIAAGAANADIRLGADQTLIDYLRRLLEDA